jgi:hypothetical protein
MNVAVTRGDGHENKPKKQPKNREKPPAAAPAGEPVPSRKPERHEQEGRGPCCPICGCRHLPVIETRQRADGSTQRLRECRHCHHYPIVTTEKISCT